MTTLVTAQHAHGPYGNGFGGCHARWGTGGFCPGVKTAEWLNSLGDDSENYGSGKRGMRGPDGRILTNLDVRGNWALSRNHHVVFVDEERARLLVELRNREADITIIKRRLEEISR